MKPEKLIEAMGDIAPEYIEEAEKTGYKRKGKHKSIKILAAAACMCILFTAAYYMTRIDGTGFSDMSHKSAGKRPETAKNAADKAYQAPESEKEKESQAANQKEEGAVIEDNESRVTEFLVEKSDTDGKKQNSQEIALRTEDFEAMNLEELKSYYGVILLPNSLPSNLSLNTEKADWGIYRNEERGVYYDKNGLVFENKGKDQKLVLAVRKLSNAMETETEKITLEYSQKEEKTDCYETLFMVGQIQYEVWTEGLSLDEVKAVISELVQQQ